MSDMSEAIKEVLEMLRNKKEESSGNNDVLKKLLDEACAHVLSETKESDPSAHRCLTAGLEIFDVFKVKKLTNGEIIDVLVKLISTNLALMPDKLKSKAKASVIVNIMDL